MYYSRSFMGGFSHSNVETACSIVNTLAEVVLTPRPQVRERTRHR